MGLSPVILKKGGAKAEHDSAGLESEVSFILLTRLPPPHAWVP